MMTRMVGGLKGDAPGRRRRARSKALATLLGLAMAPGLAVVARGEDLNQAWGVALTVNQGLQASQQATASAGFSVKAAESARYVTVRNYTLVTGLAASPTTKAAPVNQGNNANTTTGGTSGTSGGTSGTSGTSGSTGGAAEALGANTRVFLLGPNQHVLPVSLTTATFPVYTGGRLKKTVDSAQHQLNAVKSQEFRTALDLKLTVAEAYVGVLRAKKNLDTARSNVEQLASFARDTRNRLNEQLAIRSDDLAAEVSLANAQLTEITSRTALETAFATYNRYLCRPLDMYSELDEISNFPADANWADLAAQAIRQRGDFAGKDDAEARQLAIQAIQSRPELVGLNEQARSYGDQAIATRAMLKPQVSLAGGFLFLGPENFGPQGNGFLTGVVDWTFTDSGKTRRQARALEATQRSTFKQKADLAADVALEVRNDWLNLQTARQRVPIARFAVTQADENVKVVVDRYRQQLSTYTEVLDAETRRVTSLNAFFNAVYDENLAFFRLRRAVGDL